MTETPGNKVLLKKMHPACVQGGTAGSECRNMAGPSGELGEVEGGSP